MTTMLTPTIDGYALWHRVQDFGGFTADPETGEIPTSGYVVSLPGFERVYPREAFRPRDVVTALQNARQASALYPDNRVYAGAWLDAATNLVYLDASVIVPRQACAESLAREYGQLAYYALDTQTTHYIDAPAVPVAA